MKDFEQVRKPLLPILRSDRLLVRSLCEQDAKPMFDYRSLPDVSKYQSWGSKSIDEVLSFIRDNHAIEALTAGTWYQLGIVLKTMGASLETQVYALPIRIRGRSSLA